MRAIIRAVVKPFASLLASSRGTSAAPADSSPRLAPMSMHGFMRLLREDAAVRRRFARDPRGVLREAAIDPASFELPPRIDEAWLDRFLAEWAGQTGPRAPAPVPVEVPRPPEPPVVPQLLEEKCDISAPTPVYGPPPSRRRFPRR